MGQFIKRNLKRNDRVWIVVKEDNQLVNKLGTIKEIMPARHARARGVVINRSGRVFKIRTDDGKTQYKPQSSVKNPDDYPHGGAIESDTRTAQ